MTVSPGYGFPPPDASRMLASTADRERALDVLKAGFAEGRLTKDEYDSRVSQTYAARTYADLATITGDLPGGGHPTALYPLNPPGAPLYQPFQPGSPPYPPGYQLPPKASPLAMASFWCAIGGLVTLGLTSIPAVILGFMAFPQMHRTGRAGTGLATSGLVLGWIGIILLVVRVAAGGVFFH